VQPRRASSAIHDQKQSDVCKSPKDNIYTALAMAIEATETPDRMCGADEEAGASDATSVQNDSEISSVVAGAQRVQTTRSGISSRASTMLGQTKADRPEEPQCSRIFAPQDMDNSHLGATVLPGSCP